MLESGIILYELFIYVLITYFALKSGQVLHPVHIFSQSLVLPFLLYHTLSEPSLKSTTYLVHSLAITSFIIGFIISKPFGRNTPRFRITGLGGRSSSLQVTQSYIAGLFLLLGIAGFLLGTIESIQHILIGPKGPFFNLRYARTALGLELGISKYLLVFYHVFILSMIVSGQRGRYIAIFVVLWALTSIFTMARTMLFFSIFTPTVAYLLEKKYRENSSGNANKTLMLSACIFFAGFVISGISTGKISSITHHLFNYLLGPLIRFDTFVVGAECDSTVFGKNTFYALTRALEVLGYSPSSFHSTCVPGGQTYTMMATPYLEHGLIGLLIITAFFGFVYSGLYAMARDGNAYAIMVYSIYFMPLAISFYAYQFTLWGWIYHLLALALMWCCTNTIYWVKGQTRDRQVI